MGYPGLGGGRFGGLLVKAHRLPVTRWIRSGDLMHSTVAIVNNTVSQLKGAKRINLKSSHYTQKGDYVRWCMC